MSTAPVRILTLALLAVTAGVVPVSQAQTFAVIHTFSGGGEGAVPQAGLTMDAAGGLYGTTTFGGYAGGQGDDPCARDSGCGVVFKLSHHGSGWTVQQLYQFRGGADGNGPLSRVVFGPDGALYGTTQLGGSSSCAAGDGCGTVYRLTPPARPCARILCPWHESVLHAFTAGSDGATPYYGDLSFDGAGNIFGTTVMGGNYDEGVLFEISGHNGSWTESVAYPFGAGTAQFPGWGVVFDRTGNIYGAAAGGIPYDYGVIYELQAVQGGWTESTLFTFTGGTDGAGPGGGLIFDGAGNLYGATVFDGIGSGGTVYQLARSGAGWTLTTLSGIAGRAGGPYGSLTMDAAGNLYGTTNGDGAYDYGSVFKVAPQPDGSWILTDLHDFTGGEDGRWPVGNVVVDADGNLFGTASRGGDLAACPRVGCGVIWEITP